MKLERSRLEPRPEVLRLPRAVHGAVDHAEFLRQGWNVDEVFDFSANVNPFGASPRVREAVARAVVDRYPDRDSHEFRRVLGAILGVDPSLLLASNGSTESIATVALAFVRRGDRVLVLGPTYGEYARSAALLGARVRVYRAKEERDFIFSEQGVSRALARLKPSITYFCNPCNPTGQQVPMETILAWAHANPQTMFVVDEAYAAFSSVPNSLLGNHLDNLLVLRSLTKDYALAGLRLGYVYGAPDTIATLARVQSPWSVNALAQAAGVAALQDAAHLEKTLRKLASAKEELLQELRHIGLNSLPSTVHFFLLRVGDGAVVREALMREGILVRDGASFGLPEYIRISTRRPQENERLVTALRMLAPRILEANHAR